MSIERSRSQQLFESFFTVGGNPPFKQIKKSVYENTSLTQQQAQQLHVSLLQEVSELYYKSLISFAEAYVRIKHNSYSWPTIELYYSVYYATRAFLNAYDYAILRAERRLFFIKARPNESFKKCQNTTDHKATFEILQRFFKNDYLLSNQIDNMNAYDWIMARREDVNYRDRSFKDPDSPDFWETINRELTQETVKEVIEKLTSDSTGLYVFQPDYAVLGVPIKRIMLTADAIRSLGISAGFVKRQTEYVSSLLFDLPDALKSNIIL